LLEKGAARRLAMGDEGMSDGRQEATQLFDAGTFWGAVPPGETGSRARGRHVQRAITLTRLIALNSDLPACDDCCFSMVSEVHSFFDCSSHVPSSSLSLQKGADWSAKAKLPNRVITLPCRSRRAHLSHTRTLDSVALALSAPTILSCLHSFGTSNLP
jgi:hypothetical protein